MSHSAPAPQPDDAEARRPRDFWHRRRTWAGAAGLAFALLVGLLVHRRFFVHGDRELLDELIERRSPVITAWAVAVTEAFSPAGTIVLALATGLVLWWVRRSWRVPVYVFGSVALAAGITYLLKFVFERQRPPAIDRLVFEADYSFPSGHATGTAALACAAAVVVCGMLRRPWSMALVWAAALGLSVLVAATRLYLGVHWFTDTAAGFCVGAGTALVLSALIDPGRAPGRAAKGRAVADRAVPASSSEGGAPEGTSHEGGACEGRSHGGGAPEGWPPAGGSRPG